MISYSYPNCNRCSTKGCSGKVNFNDCMSHIQPADFKVPMLVHLLSKDSNVDAVTELLDRYKISIMDSHKYPFFRLRLNEVLT